MNDLVTEALQQSFKGADRRPDLADYRAARIAELEATVREFCEYVIDSGDQIGMPAKFHTQFSELCECIGFDAAARANEGFDRSDV